MTEQEEEKAEPAEFVGFESDEGGTGH
jgi:hypothetical protein